MGYEADVGGEGEGSQEDTGEWGEYSGGFDGQV